MKKQQKMKKSLRLDKEVLVQLDSPGLQRVVGGLSVNADCGGGMSVNAACGTAFICGSQVCGE